MVVIILHVPYLTTFLQFFSIEPAKATGSVISPLFGCMCGWMDGWMDVCNELIAETAPTIFLKLGMNLGENKGKKIAQPNF